MLEIRIEDAAFEDERMRYVADTVNSGAADRLWVSGWMVHLWESGREALARRIDRVARAAIPGLFVILIVSIVAVVSADRKTARADAAATTQVVQHAPPGG